MEHDHGTLSFNALKSLQYSSAGISSVLLALSNLACKVVVVVVMSAALSLRSSWDTSVNTSLPFANAWARASSVGQVDSTDVQVGHSHQC